MTWFVFFVLPISQGHGLDPTIPPPVPAEDFRLPALHAELDPVGGGRILDSRGREVILRGVNFSSFGEYWSYDPNLPTTYPFTPEDADRMAGIGWNVVRMLFSWSRVEPAPGVYDEAYLDELEKAVRILESRGIYTLLDAHQDAWGPSLAAKDDEVCLLANRAFGWDGAPAWATFDGGAPRCALMDIREVSPAVVKAFSAFWANTPGPGGVGIQTRYARMWGHVAERFSAHDAVVGYDVMNEPHAFVYGRQVELTRFYERTLEEIRAAEARVLSPCRLFFFEPSILWNDFRIGAPLPFGDDQMVYSPHLYTSGLLDLPLDETTFQQARAEAAAFGGVPVVTGEWGADPRRAADPNDGYFDTHQGFQDQYHFGAILWSWNTACGDPHAAKAFRDGKPRYTWGLFDKDCDSDQILGMREPLVAALRRPVIRAAPGQLKDLIWDRSTRTVTVRGIGAGPGSRFIVFYPLRPGERIRQTTQGLVGVHATPAIGGGRFVVGKAKGGDWELAVRSE